MKNLTLLIITLLASAQLSLAQCNKTRNCCQNPQTETNCDARPDVVKSSLIHVNAGCTDCKIAIESAVKAVTGVKNVQVDLDKNIVVVSYYTTKTDIQKIRLAISKAGYQADDLTPDPDAISLLPKKCRKH